jgi:hypothetical protein
VSEQCGMRVSLVIPLISILFVYLQSCSQNSHRPANVPPSAVPVDGVFIQCTVDREAGANRCTVYKGSTGEVLESGYFVLSGSGREANNAELRYAAFDATRIYLADARYLYPVQLENYPMPSMENRLRVLAGDGAINCGHVGRNKSARAASDCAVEAFAHLKAFTVYYDLWAIDSARSTGLAGDARGNVYAIDYDSRSWSSVGLSNEIELTDGNHIITVACPKPVKLIKNQDGTLGCIPLIKTLKPNLESPSADTP